MDVHLAAMLQPHHHQVKTVPTLANTDTALYLVAFARFLPFKLQGFQICLPVPGRAAQFGTIQPDALLLAPGKVLPVLYILSTNPRSGYFPVRFLYRSMDSISVFPSLNASQQISSTRA